MCWLPRAYDSGYSILPLGQLLNLSVSIFHICECRLRLRSLLMRLLRSLSGSFYRHLSTDDMPGTGIQAKKPLPS